jgi:hypothetical protein
LRRTKYGLVGGEEAGEDVVHVGAVVDDQHHGRVRVDARDALRVDVAEAHAVERARHAAADPVADAEVEVGVERRHDLAAIGFDLGHDLGKRDPVLRRVLLGRLLHPGIGEQAMDQRLPARALEGPDADAQARRHRVDDAVRRVRHQPAQGGDEEVLEERPHGEREQERRQPERQLDRLAHERRSR